jgi:hypothetical protein
MSAVSIRLDTRFRRLVAGWREARVRLWVLSAGESERSSSEVGLASLDFRSARRPEFEQMAQRLGVDLAGVPFGLQGALRDAERICARCQDVRGCRRWLARDASGDSAPVFCPNVRFFRTMATRRRGSSRDPLVAERCDLTGTDQ